MPKTQQTEMPEFVKHIEKQSHQKNVSKNPRNPQNIFEEMAKNRLHLPNPSTALIFIVLVELRLAETSSGFLLFFEKKTDQN